MNIVLIVAAVIVILTASTGYWRGLIRSVFATFALVVGIVLALQVMPYGTKLLRATVVYESIHDTIKESFDEKLQMSTSGVSQQMEAIESMEGVPDFIKDALKKNNNAEIYKALGISEFSEYISSYITCLILNGISLIASFIIIFIIIRIIGCMMDMMSRIPIVHGLNKIGGLCFGFVNGIVYLWIACIIVTICSGTEWGQYIFAQINESIILSFIYNNNYILSFLVNMGKVLF